MAIAMEKSRVLVVDDEPQITRVLRTVLTSQGYQVRTAAEGESAMTNFNEWRPELVLAHVIVADRLVAGAVARVLADGQEPHD